MRTARKKLLLFLFIFSSHFLFAQPVINSFSPVSGPVGSTVTINGANFDPVPGSNIVFFGAVRAEVVTAAANTLTVKVPRGANYKPITVTANQLTAYSTLSFNVTFTGGGDPFTQSSFTSSELFLHRAVTTLNVSDLDGDGKPDINASVGNAILLLRNKSTPGNFEFDSSKIDYSSAFVFSGGEDLDGDGKKDLVVLNYRYNYLTIFKNNSTPGNLVFDSILSIAGSSIPLYRAAIGDIDGDGKPDIVVCGMKGGADPEIDPPAGNVSIIKNTSSGGTMSFQIETTYPTGGRIYSIILADLNGDGKPEMITANRDDQKVLVYKNNSSPGNYTFDTPLVLNGYEFTIGLAVEDANGDSKNDILATYQFNTRISLFTNTSNAGNLSFDEPNNFHWRWPINFFPAPSHYIEAADFDGDGKPEFALGNPGFGGADGSNPLPSSVAAVQNTGATGLDPFNSTAAYIKTNGNPPVPTLNSVRAVAVGDIDGDGRPDMISTNTTDSSIILFRNLIGNASLPLRLIDFTGKIDNQNVQLQWKTADEVNTDHFVVEHSTDGLTFSPVGTIAAAGNSTHQPKQYHFLHTSPNTGVNYYRLKMVDADEQFTYSKTINVVLSKTEATLAIHPNPVIENALITHQPASNNSQITLTDMSGRIIRTIRPENNSVQTNISMINLPAGKYLVIFKNGLIQQTISLLKQ